MSSYIVSLRSIQAIVTAISKYQVLPHGGKDETKAGQLLWNLNIDAYNWRYPGENVQYAEYVYKHKPVLLPDLAVYKVVSGFLYQCAEGDLPDCELYKYVREFKERLADKVLCRISGFDELPRDL